MNRAPGHFARALTVALSFIVLAGQLGGPVTGARADSLNDRIAAARQHQKDLQRSIDRQRELLKGLQDDEDVANSALSSTSDQLDSLNTDQADVRAKVQVATDALHRVQARRDSLRAELRQLGWTLSLLEGQIQQGSEDLQAERQALGARLADAYRSQQTSLLEQVLSSASFTDVLSQASAYLNLGAQDADMATLISTDQASLDSLRRLTIVTRYKTDELRRDADAVEAELVAQQATLNQQQAKLNDLEAKTKKIQDQQLAAFYAINDTQAKIDAALAKETKDQASLQKRLKSLVAEAQRRAAQHERNNPPPPGNPGGNGNGTMIWPVSGTVTQEFGCTGFVLEPPYGNCAHFHQGMDIANASGTPVHAAKGGVIALVGWALGGSYMVVIAHSGGMQTWYGHLLPKQVVRRGQYVNQGQLIGYMGNTGHSTGTHLHFAVYLNHGNTPVNPRNYL